MRKYLYLLIFLNLTICMSKENKIISKNLPELNAAPYYAKAIQLVVKAEEHKKINIKKYQKDMEEAIKNIEIGNKMPFYIPAKNYFTRLSESKSSEKSNINEKYNRELGALGGVILHLYFYITMDRRQISGELPRGYISNWPEKILEFKNEKDLKLFVKDEIILAIFIQRIIYNPFPHQVTIELSYTGPLQDICRDLSIIYKKYGYIRESKELNDYNNLININFKTYSKRVEPLFSKYHQNIIDKLFIIFNNF